MVLLISNGWCDDPYTSPIAITGFTNTSSKLVKNQSLESINNSPIDALHQRQSNTTTYKLGQLTKANKAHSIDSNKNSFSGYYDKSNIDFLVCFDSASKAYSIPKGILLSIANVESKFRKNAINKNRNGSYDVGIMQINSSWNKKLLSMGITEKMLFSPCQNIYVGAWILSNNIKRYGYNWTAIQRYNGKDAELKYAKKVYKKIMEYDPNLIKKI